MANVNQGVRPGNAFGRLANVDFSSDDTDKVSLKPGYLIRLRDKFHLVEAMEPLAVDLFFTDTVNFGATTIEAGSDKTARQVTTPTGTHGQALAQYGLESIAAYYGFGENAAGAEAIAAADRYGNILKPNFDSGYLQFKDIEPFRGNLYQLCPTLPNQPKYMDLNGNWHSRTAFGPNDYSATEGAGFEPIGFPGTKLLAADNAQTLDAYQIGDTVDTVVATEAGFSGVAHATQVGTVSGKLYIKHPAGVPRAVLDEAPEGSSGNTPHSSAASGTIEGLSGFIDGQMSPLEAPNWSQSIFIEHGENNMPIFRYVNDSDEFIMDGRIRLVGWKYRIIELTKEQLQLFKQRSGGRLTFKIINTTGLPVSGAMLADYFPK